MMWKNLFATVSDRLFDSIELQVRNTTLTYKQFSDSASILLDQTLQESPLTMMQPITTLNTTTNTVSTQFPFPHCIFEPKPSAGRCAANTLAGTRCRAESYLPFTLCTTHWRFYQRHRSLPPGGAQAPGNLHPSEVWNSAVSAYNVYNPYGA